MLYAKPEEETPEGEVADAREKATRELPVMEYPKPTPACFPLWGGRKTVRNSSSARAPCRRRYRIEVLNTGRRRREEAGIDEGE